MKNLNNKLTVYPSTTAVVRYGSGKMALKQINKLPATADIQLIKLNSPS